MGERGVTKKGKSIIKVGENKCGKRNSLSTIYKNLPKPVAPKICRQRQLIVSQSEARVLLRLDQSEATWSVAIYLLADTCEWGE